MVRRERRKRNERSSKEHERELTSPNRSKRKEQRMKIQVRPWPHHARPDGGRGGAHMKSLGLLAALAATAITVLAVLASSGGAQSGERTIVLTQPAGAFYLVDQPPRMRRRDNAFSP